MRELKIFSGEECNENDILIALQFILKYNYIFDSNAKITSAFEVSAILSLVKRVNWKSTQYTLEEFGWLDILYETARIECDMKKAQIFIVVVEKMQCSKEELIRYARTLKSNTFWEYIANK
jgi:hypothetical protein